MCSIELIMFTRSSKTIKCDRKERGANKKQIKTKTKLKRTSEASTINRDEEKKNLPILETEENELFRTGNQYIDYFFTLISIQNFFRNFDENCNK